MSLPIEFHHTAVTVDATASSIPSTSAAVTVASAQHNASSSSSASDPSRSSHLSLLYGGRNRFWCGDRIMTGPGVDWLAGSAAAIAIPAALFIATTSAHTQTGEKDE